MKDRGSYWGRRLVMKRSHSQEMHHIPFVSVLTQDPLARVSSNCECEPKSQWHKRDGCLGEYTFLLLHTRRKRGAGLGFTCRFRFCFCFCFCFCFFFSCRLFFFSNHMLSANFRTRPIERSYIPGTNCHWLPLAKLNLGVIEFNLFHNRRIEGINGFSPASPLEPFHIHLSNWSVIRSKSGTTSVHSRTSEFTMSPLLQEWLFMQWKLFWFSI